MDYWSNFRPAAIGLVLALTIGTAHASAGGQAYVTTMRARAKLSLHEELMQVYESSPQRFSDMVPLLNEMRGEILHDAISVYWLVGPTYLSSDAEVLRELLYLTDARTSHGEYPAALQELVALNILPQLPRSPYGDAFITSETAELLPPGTVVYRPVLSRGGYVLDRDALEFYFLAVIGEDGHGEQPEIIEFGYETYGMDLRGLIEVTPRNIVFQRGFYPGPHSKYSQQLQLMD